MKTILVIDDEQSLTDLLRDTLTRKGYTVWTAGDGESGMRLAADQPDLILLDIMMPGADGYDVCRAIRDTVWCPIIFISAKRYEKDRIQALALGGDDYINKPFSLQELTAKIEAHLRREDRARERDRTASQRRLSFGKISVNLQGRELTVAGKPVALTRKQFEIVELLCLHPGQVFSKEQMYEKLWGYDADGDASTITEHVKNIRARLADADPDTHYIATVWGIGYRWEAK
jgi:DNA-binding response OmpR family regulator